MNTERFDKVIERADRVMRQLDERDGAVRDAARRERQRVNADFVRRIGRIGVAIGVISIVTVAIGLIIPIGMYQQKAVAAGGDKSTRRCLTKAEVGNYNVANAQGFERTR